MNPHQILGTKPDDGPDEIREQYRARVKQTHPDSTDTLDVETAREQFKEVKDAYDRLCEGDYTIGVTQDATQTTEAKKQRYTAIDRDEFEAFLDEHAEWKRGSGIATEFIYDIPLPQDHLTIRIFSSIDRTTGFTRPCGEDAIRCVIWNHRVGEPIAGRVRTHRIETWRSNLLEKIQSLAENWRDYDRECPVCSSPLAEKEGPYGEFFGCVRYPECDYTEGYDE